MPRHNRPQQNPQAQERQEQNMKKDRRWLKAVIAASTAPLPALPWQRAGRSRPAALATPALARVRKATR